MSSHIPPKFGLDFNALLRLRLQEGLLLRDHCVEACAELALLLRCCFVKSPKPVQSSLFDLTLFALSCLNRIEGRLVEGAVRVVVQAAEAVLPAQKKASVRREHKQTVIERKRRQDQQRKESADDSGYTGSFPPDVLHHVFSFLDVVSLGRASTVCQSWRDVSRQHETVWRFHLDRTLPVVDNGLAASDLASQSAYDAFVSVASGLRGGELLSNRVLCKDCGVVLWVPLASAADTEISIASCAFAQTTSLDAVPRLRKQCCHNQWCLASSSQVVSCLEILDFLDSSSDDSDSDIDSPIFRRWAAPKISAQ